MQSRALLPVLIIFDTCTLPEYYNDVHSILALPSGHVITYDYSVKHVSSDTVGVLTELSESGKTARTVLAYVQGLDYVKGAGTDSQDPVPDPAFATLTRLGTIIAVRSIDSDYGVRYYIDIEVNGYPYDPGRTTASAVLAELRKTGNIPMKSYVSTFPGTAAKALFNTKADEQAYSQVIDTLSTSPSQFAKDTFWRIRSINSSTKSLLPMLLTKPSSISPKTGSDADKRYSYFDIVDQTILRFNLQFYRGKEEHGRDYRARQISVEASPKASSDLVRSKFLARAFGQETISVAVPATSSLSQQEVRFQLITELHHDDDQKTYPYGPQLTIVVRYRKSIPRSGIAIASIGLASGMFAFAAFATSVFAARPAIGYVIPLEWRVCAVILGVLLTLYAYYLWTDEVTLDKVRRS